MNEIEFQPLNEALLVADSAQADKFIAARVAVHKKRGDKRPDAELEKLERSNVCQWAAIWAHQYHGRMIALFRPEWPPPPEEPAPKIINTTKPQRN